MNTKIKSEKKPEPIPPYFYDGSLLLAEKVGSQITKIYINDGQGIVGMVRPIYDGSNQLTHYQRLYFLFDSMGSVSAVAGEHGLPLQNYSYSPYGTCLNVTNDPINSLQFIGRYGGYLDSDTGLTYFWHRWYDSKDGRWISRDPIGVNGGINVYAYTLNSPTNWLDISGLAIGDFPPAPPGYNPNTWTSGQWDNGKLWVKSPDGRTYTIHTEDSGHWRHWDIDDDSKWPPDSGKKRSNQDKTKKGQCEIDPSGDTPPWNPPSLFSEYSFFFYPMFGPIPFTFTAPCFGFCTPVFAW